MHDPASELPRIPLPRTSVNKRRLGFIGNSSPCALMPEPSEQREDLTKCLSEVDL